HSIYPLTLHDALPISRIFNESNDQLLYLRNRNMFLSEISPGNPAPYNIPGGGAGQSPYQGFSKEGDVAVTQKYPSTRKEWCAFKDRKSTRLNSSHLGI